MSSTSYCINLVRQYDYENYLCSLLLDNRSRQSVFALRAFNVEIAKISDSVTVETIGNMKIQFWTDALDNIYAKGQCPNHPVAKELKKAIGIHNISKIWFTKLLEGRANNLHDRPFESTDALEEYSEQTVSSILYLTLEALGVKDTNADHCASHLGKAIGIGTLLRSTLRHAKSRTVLWPTDILLQHGVSQEDILRGKNRPAVKEATFQLASLAHVHLDKARSLCNGVPTSGFRGLLPAVPCDSFLKTLQRTGFDIFHAKLFRRNTMLPILLLKSAWRRTF